MKVFELLPRPLGKIFRKLTHLTCNSPVLGYKIPELVKHEKIKARKLSYDSQVYLLMQRARQKKEEMLFESLKAGDIGILRPKPFYKGL